MKTYKTIRLSQNTYEELLAYRAELEAINRQNLSFDETVDMALGEPIALEHENSCLKGHLHLAQQACTCGKAAEFVPKQA